MPPELTSRAGQGAMLGCIGSHYTGNVDGDANGDLIDRGWRRPTSRRSWIASLPVIAGAMSSI